jgi:rubredoxin
MRTFKCTGCGNLWQTEGNPAQCDVCGSTGIFPDRIYVRMVVVEDGIHKSRLAQWRLAAVDSVGDFRVCIRVFVGDRDTGVSFILNRDAISTLYKCLWIGILHDYDRGANPAYAWTPEQQQFRDEHFPSGREVEV